MMTAPAYLPLFSSEGHWIDRPDLFLLARMGASDDEDEEVVREVYEAMCNADNSQAELNTFGKSIERNHVRGRLSERVKAGEVLLEMVRIAATLRRPASEARAVTLAAYNQHQTFRTSSMESLKRDFRRAFSDFRNTSHLQAAMVFGAPSVGEIECSLELTEKFLSRARGFEAFIDINHAGGPFKWSPWRVPARIPIMREINIAPLSEQELNVIR